MQQGTLYLLMCLFIQGLEWVRVNRIYLLVLVQLSVVVILFGVIYSMNVQAIPNGTVVKALVYDQEIVNVTGSDVFVRFYVLYFGSGQKDLSVVEIKVLSTDGSLLVNNKIVTAVVSDATKYGYVITNSDVIFQRWARGFNVL